MSFPTHQYLFKWIFSLSLNIVPDCCVTRVLLPDGVMVLLLYCSKETFQVFFCLWEYLHSIAKSPGNPLATKGLFSKGFSFFSLASGELGGRNRRNRRNGWQCVSCCLGWSRTWSPWPADTHCFPLTLFFIPPHLSGKADLIACHVQHLSQGSAMAEVSLGIPLAWS